LIFLLKGLFFKAAKVWEERRNGKKTGIKIEKKTGLAGYLPQLVPIHSGEARKHRRNT
jgi:hypothetical protein